ncbi:MAG: hypothetical protein ABI581_04765 [Sediminibacterium sp.]
MKPVASILSLLMLFLMAQPMLVECQAMVKVEPPVTVCGAKSCHKAAAQKKLADKRCCDKSKECDKTNACNPFASCSQCQYVAVSRYMYAGDQALAHSKRSYPTKENIVTGFTNVCWQPPEPDSFS